MITKPESPPRLVQAGHRRRQVLPASWIRSGTSKGLFIDRRHLPTDQEAWSSWILAAMGSKNQDPRQLDGIGGATSTTSKVAIVSPSSRPGIDVEYTFAQVAVGKDKIDYSGNCGNIASGVGPFALEEGMVEAKPGQKKAVIRILNTNTGRTLVETVAVDEEGYYLELGDYRIAGVKATGSEIKVAFVDPAGAMTGKLFPTGNPEDTIVVDEPRTAAEPYCVQATLIDVANPFVMVDESTLPLDVPQGSTEWLDMVEDIRRKAAVMMGLAETTEQASLTRGTPKIHLVSTPPSNSTSSLGSRPDIFVLAMSMGQPHPSVQLTGAVCLAAATCLEGTVAHRISSLNSLPNSLLCSKMNAEREVTDNRNSLLRRKIVIAHGSGQIPVEVKARLTPGEGTIESCSVSRTARKLFEGNVLFYT